MAKIKGTSAFPKIYHDTDPEFDVLLGVPVEITEKLDGSQIGFGVVNGELVIRTKGNAIDLNAVNGLFAGAVATILKAHEAGLLREGCFYYGETLQTRRHNRLCYDRVPKGHIALFAIKRPDGSFCGYWEEMGAEAHALGVDVVPRLYSGRLEGRAGLDAMLDEESRLGGAKREGIVIKAYDVKVPYKEWEVDCPVLAGKLVNEGFKEVMKKTRKEKPEGSALESKVREFFGQYRTEARWHKAIQHLRDDGLLEGRMSDIGKLVKAIQNDVMEEEEEHIRDGLWRLLKRDCSRELVDGFPQMYEAMLREQARERAEA